MNKKTKKVHVTYIRSEFLNSDNNDYNAIKTEVTRSGMGIISISNFGKFITISRDLNDKKEAGVFVDSIDVIIKNLQEFRKEVVIKSNKIL